MKPYLSIGGLALVLVVAGLGLLGCTGPAVRPQSPDDIEQAGAEVDLVGNLAIAHQMAPLAVEAIGLVVNLPGTGSDPPPSPQRALLLDEMQTRGVLKPNQLLASGTSSLVLLRGYLRPGIQKGDRFDLEVRVPSHSETASLRGGWLMETRMTELAILGNQIHDGHLRALAEGPVLVDPAPAGESSNELTECRARILGGGMAIKSRPLGLVLKPDFQSARYSSAVGTAINRRFHTFVNGNKQGVAAPKNHEYIELTVHPRYKDNIERYMLVVRSTSLSETANQRVARLTLLERQLLDPVTAAMAALRLEAIGQDGVKSLLKGIKSADPEVRFYAAEALAYLDEKEAAEPLAEAVRSQPAFRVYALAALSAMDDVAAYDQLCQLLSGDSAETRYGAFRALWAMNPDDALIRGQSFDGKFSYHVLATQGTPMIHATRSHRPEIVVFGQDQRFITPLVLDAGPQIMLNADAGGEITISKFTVGQPDQKRVVSTKVDEVIRAIVELGGAYPDVVQVLQQAKETHALTSRFEVDALPEAGRRYYRERETASDALASDQAVEGGETSTAGNVETEAAAAMRSQEFVVENPAPSFFAKRSSRADREDEDRKPAKKADAKAAKNAHPVRTFFAKMTGRKRE